MHINVRQIIHDSANAGMNKAESAVRRLRAINPSADYQSITQKLTCENAIGIFAAYDLIVDATDNFEARYIINDACVLLNKILVTGSAVGMEGQITIIVPQQSACFRCLFPEPSNSEQCRTCANAGVLGPVPGLIGCFQAIEAIKVILMKVNATQSMECLSGRQIFIDAATAHCYDFELPARNKDCAVCGDSPTITSMKDVEQLLSVYQQCLVSAQQSYSGELDLSAQMSMREYSKLYLSQLETGEIRKVTVPHIIIDVRSKHQFSLTSFHFDNLVKFNTVSTATAFFESNDCNNDTPFLINIPLPELKSSENTLQMFKTLYCKLSDSKSSPLHIMVVCRRGIDSVVATRYLLQNGFVSNVFNLVGGLTCWKSDIDNRFPMY